MAKRQIRLTEGDLHRIVKESVIKILKESKRPNPMGGPEDRINAYPEYARDWKSEEPMFPIPNNERLHTLNRMTDYHSNWEKDDHAYFDSGEPYPSAEWSDKQLYSQWTKDADDKLAQQDFNKKWQNTQDKIKYSQMADSRPLHRKGSLNREL